MEEKEKKVIYTNSIGISASLFDIKLLVNYISDNNENNETKKDNICEIVMSPQHAKAFLNVLQKTIESYEKGFGEINLNNLAKTEKEKEK